MKQFKHIKPQERGTVFILKESQIKRLINKLVLETIKGGKAL
jgi:hypothetical protein